MALRIPLGVSDFRNLREEGLAYIDKSHLIREVLEKGAQAILLPRHRRFGKTLNLTMLRWFFEKRAEDLWGLFADLSIARAGEAYREHFQKYPVVFISFKEVKGESWDASRQDIYAKISALFDEHRHLLDSDRVSELDRAGIRAILDGTADDVIYRFSLLLLTRCLAVHYDQKVVVLLDGDDTLIHDDGQEGCAPKIITFFRVFFDAGLKDNITSSRW